MKPVSQETPVTTLDGLIDGICKTFPFVTDYPWRLLRVIRVIAMPNINVVVTGVPYHGPVFGSRRHTVTGGIRALVTVPELAGFLFRLTALEESLKDRSTLIFDQQTPPFDLFRGFSTNSIKR